MKHLSLKWQKRSSTVLTFIGAAGVIATAILSAKATPKAVEILRENSGWTHEGIVEEPTSIDKIKLCWKCYIPAAAVGLSTIICIFGANGINKKRQAALISAYGLLRSSFNEYKDKVAELMGEEGVSEIRKAVSKDHFKEQNIPEEGGKLLFYDYFSGQYFTSTMAELIDAEYQMNRKFAVRGYVTIGEWYELLNLPNDMFNDVLGWSLDNEDDSEFRWIDYEHELAKTEDGRDYYIVHMIYPPSADFIDYC